jgi:hypothetical protein
MGSICRWKVICYHMHAARMLHWLNLRNLGPGSILTSTLQHNGGVNDDSSMCWNLIVVPWCHLVWRLSFTKTRLQFAVGWLGPFDPVGSRITCILQLQSQSVTLSKNGKLTLNFAGLYVDPDFAWQLYLGYICKERDLGIAFSIF